jgi:tetratricopeptide (TPR) repeat protein
MMTGMKDADALVEKALECLEREDHEQAKVYLKEAATAAPLRSDIREMLRYTLEEAPSSGRVRASSGGERSGRMQPAIAVARRRRSLRMMAATVGVFLLMACLGSVVAYLAGYRPRALAWPRLGGAPQEGLSPSSEPTPLTEVDPLAQERADLLAAATGQIVEMKFSEAIETLNQALKLDPPDRAPILKELGRCYYELGRRSVRAREGPKAGEEAIEHFNKAIEADPGNPEYHFWLGCLLRLKGVPAKGVERDTALRAAERALQKAIDLNPEGPLKLDCHMELAQVCIAQDKKLEAGKHYRTVMDLAPDSAQAEEASKRRRSMGMRN